MPEPDVALAEHDDADRDNRPAIALLVVEVSVSTQEIDLDGVPATTVAALLGV